MEGGFADILQANLSALKDVRLVEREKLYVVLNEQKLTLAGLVNTQTAVNVASLLGADRLIYGSFVEMGDRLRLDVRLADTKTAAVLRAETALGPTDKFADMLGDHGLRLVADLSVEPPATAGALVQAATPTRSIEAALHFANAATCYEITQDFEQAKRYYKIALSAPDLNWWTPSVYSAWTPLHLAGSRSATETGTTQNIVTARLRNLEIQP